MWITSILLRRHVPGRIFSGKHRVAIKVTRFQRKRVKENNLRIENNQELLSYPYLTVSEEKSHAAARNIEQRDAFSNLVRNKRNLGKPVFNVFSPKVKGFLEHLNVTKK